MSRYRIPARPGARYITPAGEKALQSELQRLWKVERPELTRAVAAAAALGDRSENAEYIYGKKRLREIDRRIRYLSKRLEVLIVVSAAPDDTSRIYFGAWTTLQDGSGRQFRYRLVGPDEISPREGHISIDSPLGRALLGKQAGSRVAVATPEGTRHYRIVQVDYET